MADFALRMCVTHGATGHDLDLVDLVRDGHATLIASPQSDDEAAQLAAAVERGGHAHVRLYSQRSELVAVVGAVDEHESFGLACGAHRGAA